MITQPSSPAYRTNDAPRHIVIVGGGITGLSAAWTLQQQAIQQGLDVRYTVLEQSTRWGGKVYTERVESEGDTPFILETGPDAFLTRKTWALELARELGLDDQLLSVNTENNRTFVLHNGQPVPLPTGLQLLAPTQWLPFLRSPLFSARGKIRALLEPLIPTRHSASDETLASFVRRRLGAEMLDKLGEPLLAGVYNGDPERQSMAATFPQFPALERQHSSLIRGLRQTKPQTSHLSNAHTTPPFVSFKSGTHELIRALVAQLTGDLRLETGVRAIEPLFNNSYRIITTQGDALEADALILTTPAPVTAALLRSFSPQAADQLSGIPYSGVGSAYFAFHQRDVPHPLHGFGLVVPASEKRPIDGVTWTSSKWTQRAPTGDVLLRVFFGGPRTAQTLSLDDAELIRVLRGELASIFGITAEPLFHRIYRWAEGYPQYNLGHLERVAAIEAALPSNIAIAGSAYRGVGVPDCVRQGRDAARQTISLLSKHHQTA